MSNHAQISLWRREMCGQVPVEIFWMLGWGPGLEARGAPLRRRDSVAGWEGILRRSAMNLRSRQLQLR